MRLRPYQQQAVQNLRQGFRDGHKHQVLQLATGGGKTAIASHMAKTAHDKGGRIWFVVDSIELIDQTIETFDKFDLDCAVIQGKHEKTDYRKDIQVATAQTITRRWHIIDRNPQWRPTMMIIDECHVIYKAHKELIGMFKDKPIIGLSASPWAKGMGNMYSNLVVGARTGELISEGHLCKYTAYAPSTPDLSKIHIQGGDYKPDELDEIINTKVVVGDVVKNWMEKGENRYTIVFAINIAHSKAIAEEFKANGVNAVHLDGYTNKNERAEIIAKFKLGLIKVLVGVGVLTKGFDSPNATCLIIARPTKSLMLHVQILGRILRISPCGKDALIFDHSGNLERLGFPDDDMPEFLDDGKRKDKAKNKLEELEREERAPNPCEACGTLHNVFKCPTCGFEPKLKHGVRVVEGKLKKIEASASQKRNRTTSKEDKQAFYSSALTHAREHGFKQGWASHAYRDYYHVYPNAYQKIYGEINQEFKNFMIHKNIAYSKRKDK